MRACARYPVLLLQADLFYYREHPGQIGRTSNAALQYAKVPAHLWNALAASDCPLDDAERVIARRNVAFTTAKSVWQAALRGDFRLAWQRIARSQITASEWFRYLRPPQRSAAAGTP
jgi:hypothetical protein